MANILAANIVRILHILFVLWMILIPFSNNEPMLVLHLIVSPFLWLHWLTSQDACSLTLLECYLRGVPSDQSFFHSVVSPVYKIQDETIRGIAWVASIGLWLVTLSKVLKRPQMITDVFLLRPPKRCEQTTESSSESPLSSSMDF